MKHKTILFALLGILTAVFILVRYGLFIVYWFTTPNALERTEAEKQLIEHLKEITENERKYKRQKYRHYGEHFISSSVVGLCIFEVLKHRV